MDEMTILKGAALLFGVAVFLMGAESLIERIGNAKVNSPAGCILHSLFGLIALPIIFAAVIAMVLGAIFLIMTYGV